MQACRFEAELFVVHTTVWKILLSQGPAALIAEVKHICALLGS